jgi:phosphopantothenoylcysteine decarboxylase / phosphopantothenate---cysteine ligase
MNVLYCISGGIAAYKAPEVVRALTKAGHSVRCVLTANAERLVTADALAAVSHARVATTMWPHDGSMPHIELPRWCECLLIAPATADLLAKLALGLADDLVTTLFLALEPTKKVVVAPAMNTVMWGKPAVQAHVRTLKDWRVRFVEPVPGELACGEVGLGAMASPEAITAAVAG